MGKVTEEFGIWNLPSKAKVPHVFDNIILKLQSISRVLSVEKLIMNNANVETFGWSFSDSNRQ
jgi:hypothetical protein